MARTSIVNDQNEPSPQLVKAREQSCEAWQRDLVNLLQDSQELFGDVAWTERDGSDVIWSHKAILYARASNPFLLKYLQGYQHPSSLSLSTNASHTSCSSYFGGSVDTHDSTFLTPSGTDSPGAFSLLSTTSTLRPPLALDSTDKALLRPLLEYLYTAKEILSDQYQFFFDQPESESENPVERLQDDLLFMWRAKLFADVQIQILAEGTSEPPVESDCIFTVHRAILAARVPYFKSQLLSSFADSSNRLLTLPSPPFTPAALHFTLGYIYCGKISFSNRTFDLSTSFSIWRCAQYLGLDDLRKEIEVLLEDASTGVKPDPTRCARIFNFAASPDVSCHRLATLSRAVIVSKFGDAWREEIGHLDQTVQQGLVTEVCAGINSATVVDALRQINTARSKLSLINVRWKDHILQMLMPIETRIQKVLAKDCPAVVLSPAFVGLLQGRTFSSDVLEQCLQLIVKGLDERYAATTYQAIVGNVLLREDGLPMDSRVFVEDCRKGIIKFLKSRWVGVRSNDGFNELEAWALKEIADELELKSLDLITTNTPKATMPVVKKSSAPRKSADPDDRPAPLRATILNRNAARQSRHSLAGELPSSAASSTFARRSTPSVTPPLPKSASTRSTFSVDKPESLAPTIDMLNQSKSVPRRFPTINKAPSISSQAVLASSSSSQPNTPIEPASRSVRSVKTSTTSQTSIRTRTASTMSSTARSGPSSRRSSRTSDFQADRPAAVSSAQPSVTTKPRARTPSLPRPPSSASIASRKTVQSTKSLVTKKSNSTIKEASQQQKPEGTVLKVAIPCIVSISGKKAKAKVHYLGLVPTLGKGSWVGVDMSAEEANTFEKLDLPWSDGKIKGLSYFELSDSTARALFLRPSQVMFLF